MEGDVLQALLRSFVDSAATGAVPLSEEIIEQFGEDCKNALRRNFTESRERDFRIRMSNIGRPLCQLQMEKAGTERAPLSYADIMKFTYGDMVEALMMAIIKASGVPVDGVQVPVKLYLDDKTAPIEGTDDVEIGGKVWDIKSASDWTFKYKWSQGYEKIAEDDAFGYIAQGHGYAAAREKPFGGWIVVNKNNGDFCVTSAPEHKAEEDRTAAVETIREKRDALEANVPFKRCFEDEPEIFYRKPTGNRKLVKQCEFCPYLQACWPEAVMLPSRPSTAQNPPLVYYTKIDDGKE